MRDKSGDDMLKMQIDCDIVMVVIRQVRRPRRKVRRTPVVAAKISQLICIISV